MKILGISALYHDSAAALLVDGEIIAAAQEERFTRIKHDASLPHESISFCLESAGLKMADIDHIAFYDKPFLKFERLLETYLATAPRGFHAFRTGFPLWIKEKLFQRRLLTKELGIPAEKLLFSEHHLSHAASAFFPSPFAEAAVLTMDGVGEWTTTSLAIGRGDQLEIKKETHFPHSIGLLYSAFTYYLGFKVNSGEYKVMGLAPYGEPVYRDLILKQLVDLKPDGSFRLDLNYFEYYRGLRMTNAKFAALFGRPVRPAEAALEEFHFNVAASIQAVTEEIVLRLGRSIAKETGMKNLCLAGGVALNCVANGKLLRDGCFEHIWAQPAAGDAGGALGAAYAAHHLFLKQKRKIPAKGDAMKGAFLGPEFSEAEIGRRLKNAGAVFEVLPDEDLFGATALALEQGKAVGWMQGKMEFGPRALGGRSILADPRSPSMQSILNLKVKFRESFRPFAPAVPIEKASAWFELREESPYMLFVAPVASAQRRPVPATPGLAKLQIPHSSIPAVTHVDFSARVQTVAKETNPRFHRLLETFGGRTGCPVLINTSFNVRGEPIVNSPEDAFRCFMGTGIEVLVVGNHFLRKEAQPPALTAGYQDTFELD